MARAGFYTEEECRLRFGRDGQWYANDEPITNRRISKLFSRHIQRESDGQYVLRIGAERAEVTVDDTPFVIVATCFEESGGIQIELNDGSREDLDPATLWVGGEDVLYCLVKDGTERSRFLRSAYYDLATRFVESASGEVALAVGARTYPIRESLEKDER